MEYFNIDNYKDWEIDSTYSALENEKFLKKRNERVQIIIDDEIEVKYTNVSNPFGKIKVYYSNNKSLKSILYKFYNIQIETYKKFSETGEVIVENNMEKPYKFSLNAVIKKVKKEYEIDLEDKTQKCFVERSYIEEFNKKSFYAVSLRDKENESKIQYILLDGTTGETLFTTYFILQDDSIPPFAQYIESLKRATEEK